MFKYIAESSPESNPNEQQKIELPTESKPKHFPVRNIIILIVVIVGGGIGIYYALSSQTVNSVYINMNKFNSSSNAFLGTYIADISMEIGNKGSMDVTLSEMQTTLYINGLNVATKGFQENWYKFQPGNSEVFTGKYASLDSKNSATLANTNSYDVILVLKAKAQSGLVTDYIEVQYSGTWYH